MTDLTPTSIRAARAYVRRHHRNGSPPWTCEDLFTIALEGAWQACLHAAGGEPTFGSAWTCARSRVLDWLRLRRNMLISAGDQDRLMFELEDRSVPPLEMRRRVDELVEGLPLLERTIMSAWAWGLTYLEIAALGRRVRRGPHGRESYRWVKAGVSRGIRLLKNKESDGNQ